MNRPPERKNGSNFQALAPPRPALVPRPTPELVPPARRIRAERTGNNSYTLAIDTFDGPPKSVEILGRGLTRNEAEAQVRIWNLDFVGTNGLGESGL